MFDVGSSDPFDPFLAFTATKSGIYFLAVSHFANDYIDDAFAFDNGGDDGGSYRLVVSTPTLPSLTTLSSGANVATFGDTPQRVDALGGNDSIALGGANDVVDGAGGADTLWGEAGNDQLYGGLDDDDLDGGLGHDVLFGDAGSDTLLGGGGQDEISGGAGRDRLLGGAAADRLWGDADDDVMFGEGGNDFIRGGLGSDEMRGGGGADTFHFLADEADFDPVGLDQDTIADFSGFGLGGDLIDLSDAFSGTLSFRGFGSFTGVAGEVCIQDLRNPVTGAGFQEALVDLDGDGFADMGVLVDARGSVDLRQQDFVL
jgi:Ca2+-binding RTX toxin-like protein